MGISESAMKIHRGSEIEVAVESMAFTGRGVGRVDNRVVFVSGGIPGDRVLATITKKKKSYFEASVKEILEPSPDRIDPPCRHFDICGGCSFQIVPYEKQLHYKEEFIRDAIVRIGGIENPPIRKIIAGSEQLFYRNKMEFSFLPMPDAPARLGLHVRGKWSEVFDVDECLLQSPKSNEIVQLTRKLVNELGIPAYHISRHEGFIRFLVIRDSKCTGKVLVNIVTNEGESSPLDKLVATLAENFPEIAAIYRTINSTPANVATGEREELLWHSEALYETIGSHKFAVAPTTFLQTNSVQTPLLYDQILELADFSGDQEVLDLYCGCGTISLYISEYVRSVLGVEVDEKAVHLAERNALENGVTNCSFVAADAARFLQKLVQDDAKFDRVVVDPPRAGMGNKVVRRLARLEVPLIVYVSCNPSTLARDLEQFRLWGYSLKDCIPVDMFPQTFHVETVNRLEKD
jgi:23S rRNA (uracil1939-C5)-methyltransferase